MNNHLQTFHDSMMEYSKHQLLDYSDILRVESVKHSDKKPVIIEKIITFIQNNAIKILDRLPLYELVRLEKIIHSPERKVTENRLDLGIDLLLALNLTRKEKDEAKELTLHSLYSEFYDAFAAAIPGYIARAENQERFQLEQRFIGLLNIYGTLNIIELIKLYQEYFSESNVRDIAPFIRDSFLPTFCAIGFSSDTDPLLCKSPLMRDNIYVMWLAKIINYKPINKAFTCAEITQAGEMPHPIITTKELEPVLAWFKKQMYPSSGVRELLSYIWISTNERSDFTPLLHLLFNELKLSDAQVNKALSMFNDYFNSLPSWVLNGYSESSYVASVGTDAHIRAAEESIREKMNSLRGFDKEPVKEEDELIYDQARAEPMVRIQKTGSNDPCSCGSGWARVKTLLRKKLIL